MRIIELPIYYVDADMSILGYTIKKGLKFFVSSIKSKGWLVVEEGRNEMILQGNYANVDDCTMTICYTRDEEISKVNITFSSKPKYKEEIFKNLVDAFNEKYGEYEYCNGLDSLSLSSSTRTWIYPKVKDDFKEGYYSEGNNSINMCLTQNYLDKYDTLSIDFVDRTISGKRYMEENEIKKNERRGFSLTDI